MSEWGRLNLWRFNPFKCLEEGLGRESGGALAPVIHQTTQAKSKYRKSSLGGGSSKSRSWSQANIHIKVLAPSITKRLHLADVITDKLQLL